MVSFAGLTRRSKAKTKDFANRGIDIVVTLVLGIVLTFVWFLMGTKLLGGGVNEGNLPSNSQTSPYCCKGSKGSYFSGYGFPYNLGDDPAVFSFIPCAIKILSLNWLRTLFYFKPWLAGTTKGSWSTQRGIMLSIASYMPTHGGKSMKGGGFLGNTVTKFKTKGRDTAAFMKNKGIGAADFVKKKGTGMFSWLTGKVNRGDWNFGEFLFFALAPLCAMLALGIMFLTSVPVTFYSSFKSSPLWTIIGFLIVFGLAAIMAALQFLNMFFVLFFKGLNLNIIKQAKNNFFKYGRGPFVFGTLLLVLSKFPEIALHTRLILLGLTPLLLYYMR
jgi:hypothetical protein